MTINRLAVLTVVCGDHNFSHLIIVKLTGQDQPHHLLFSQPTAGDIGAVKTGTTEIGTTEISKPEISTTEIGIAEIGTLEISIPEISTPEISTPEISSPEIGTLEISILETGFGLNGTPQCAFFCHVFHYGSIGPSCCQP